MKNTMKKILCVLLCASMLFALLSGCGKIKNTVKLVEIAEANSTKNLLEVYDSVLVTFVDISGSEYGYYVDHEVGYYWGEAFTDNDGTSYDAYCEVTTSSYQIGMGGDQPYSVLYAGGAIDSSLFADLVVNPSVLPLETLTETVEKDGNVIYKTKLTILELVDLGYTADADTIKDYYLTEYTVDSETLHFQTVTDMCYDENDNVKEGFTCTIEYNAKRPEAVENLMAAHEAEKDLCTVRVVKDMGTEKESTETFSIPKGDILYFYWYGDYESAYTDLDCTKDFEDGSVITEDTTIYLK